MGEMGNANLFRVAWLNQIKSISYNIPRDMIWNSAKIKQKIKNLWKYSLVLTQVLETMDSIKRRVTTLMSVLFELLFASKDMASIHILTSFTKNIDIQ